MKFGISNPFLYLFGVYICKYFSFIFHFMPRVKKALTGLMYKFGKNKSEMRANQTVTRKQHLKTHLAQKLSLVTRFA